MKKVKYPLLRGNKIVSAVIMNNLKLIDSYAFVSQALSKFPSIFSIEEEQKDFFPHLFNRPEFYSYVGPIPHSDYYTPDTFSPAKRTEFFEWYNKQVEEKAIFRFSADMKAYCHSDVQLLRKGMQKFRELFKSLTTPDGNTGEQKFIGCDPFDHITIAAASFDGIYRRYFLPEQTITVVPRPTKSNYSIISLL